jgi:TetR/AcrR family transcriptional regulator
VYELGQKEERILEAAARVFLEKGKDGATMQEIARRAHVNKALVHYYFRSKDRLYELVYAREFERLVGELVDALPETDDIQKFLRFFIDNYLERLARHQNLTRFILWEIWQGGGTVGKVIRHRVFKDRTSGTPFDPMIEKAVREGVIRPIDPVNFAISLMSVCIYPFVARPILENIFPDLHLLSPDFLERRKEEVFELFWNGIKLEPELAQE